MQYTLVEGSVQQMLYTADAAAAHGHPLAVFRRAGDRPGAQPPWRVCCPISRRCQQLALHLASDPADDAVADCRLTTEPVGDLLEELGAVGDRQRLGQLQQRRQRLVRQSDRWNLREKRSQLRIYACLWRTKSPLGSGAYLKYLKFWLSWSRQSPSYGHRQGASGGGRGRRTKAPLLGSGAKVWSCVAIRACRPSKARQAHHPNAQPHRWLHSAPASRTIGCTAPPPAARPALGQGGASYGGGISMPRPGGVRRSVQHYPNDATTSAA